MQRNETHRIAIEKRPRIRKGTFNRVFDEDTRRVRGLWIRNGVYYAQVRFSPTQTGKLPLHDAKTLPQAISARQALKRKIKHGEIAAPGAPKSPDQKLPHVPVEGRTLKAAIERYQHERDMLEHKDPGTERREDSGFNKMIEFRGTTPISDVDALWLKDFSIWRKEQSTKALKAKEEGLPAGKGARTLGGRALDLDKLALDHVLDWAVTEKWLTAKPDLKWERKAKAPKVVRLISEADLDALCTANLVTPASLALLPKRSRHLRAPQAKTAEAFASYLRLMALTGGREHESIVQEWEHVNWERRVINFPGENAKAGAGEPAAPRDIPFYDKLEAHLMSMKERSKTSSGWMFPSSRNPKEHTKSFRKQLEHAKSVTGQRDVGFHHMKHFFISGCVMRGVDFKTIALWASHRDGGVLIGRIYGHLAPGHAEAQAQKLNGGQSLLPSPPPAQTPRGT